MNSSCVQQTVKQWLICKQPADNCKRKKKKSIFSLLMRLGKFLGICTFNFLKFHWHGPSCSTAETCHRLLEILAGYLNIVRWKTEDDCSFPATPPYTPLGTPPWSLKWQACFMQLKIKSCQNFFSYCYGKVIIHFWLYIAKISKENKHPNWWKE